MHAFTFPKSVFPHWRKRDLKTEPSKVARGLKSRCGNGAQVAAGKKQRQSWGRGAGGKSRVKIRVREEMKKIGTFI